MKIDKLFTDATGIGMGESGRAKQRAVADMLAADGHEVRLPTVKKWFERGSITTGWLMKIAAAAEKRGRPLKLTDYN
jgi:hypothetical protein